LVFQNPEKEFMKNAFSEYFKPRKSLELSSSSSQFYNKSNILNRLLFQNIKKQKNPILKVLFLKSLIFKFDIALRK